MEGCFTQNLGNAQKETSVISKPWKGNSFLNGQEGIFGTLLLASYQSRADQQARPRRCLSPEGAIYQEPRATPWEKSATFSPALKGRFNLSQYGG